MNSSSKTADLHQHLTYSVFYSGFEISWHALILWWTRENVRLGSAAPKANSSGAANQRRAGPQLFQPSWHQCIHWWSRWSTNQVQHHNYRTKKTGSMKWWRGIKYCKNLNIKGIMSRICRLLFENKTFKVGPSSRLKVHVLLVVPHAYDLVTGHYVFIESCPSHALRVVFGWGLHTTAQRLMPRNIPNRKENTGRGQGFLQIQTPPHTSSGS